MAIIRQNIIKVTDETDSNVFVTGITKDGGRNWAITTSTSEGERPYCFERNMPEQTIQRIVNEIANDLRSNRD